MSNTPTKTLATDPSKPAFVTAAAAGMRRAVCFVRDLYAGTFKLQAEAARYLPQMPAEDEASYKARVETSELFNAFKKTVAALVGLVFAQEMAVAEDAHARVVELCEDIDLEGNHVSVFAKELFTDALRDGHAFVLTEMSRAVTAGDNAAGQATLFDEVVRAGLRPYWVKYLADQAVNWRHGDVGGARKLVQITFEELKVEPEGLFGERVTVQYRVLRLDEAGEVVGQVWSQEKPRDSSGAVVDGPLVLTPGDEYRVKTLGGQPLKELPVAVVYGERTGLLTSAPPLLDLALLNLKHFRMTSDLHNLMHICNVPILWAKGRDTEEKFQAIGATIMIDLEANAESALGYAEVKASGLKNTQEEIDRIERRIGVLGVEMLTEKDGKATTATEYSGNQRQSTSALATAARSLQDCLEESARFLAVLLGLPEPEGGSFVLNIAWDKLVLTAEEVNALLAAKEKGVLDTQTILELLKEAGRLPGSLDVKTVLERLFGKGMAEASEQDRSIAAAEALTKATTPAEPADPEEDDADPVE